MTPLDPSAFEPNDERLSRALDQDLSAEEQAVLDADLQGDPQLRERLAELGSARRWLAEPVAEPDDATFDRLLGRALEMFHVEHSDHAAIDAAAADGAAGIRTDPPVAGLSPDPSPTATVTPFRPPQRAPQFRSLRGLSIAAALLAVVAAAALFARSTATSSSDSQTLAEAARSTGPASAAVADAAASAEGNTATKAAASEALSTPLTTTTLSAAAGSTPVRPSDQVLQPNAAPPGTGAAGAAATTAATNAGSIPAQLDQGTIRTYASVGDLLADIASTSSYPPAGTGPNTAPATASTAAFATAAVGSFDAQCGADLPALAMVGDRLVRWGTRPGPTTTSEVHLVVVDPATCVLLADASR